jgi:hypothetical protein
MQLWFVALPLITLADLGARFTGPIFIRRRRPVLGEDVRLRRWMAAGRLRRRHADRAPASPARHRRAGGMASTPLFSASNLWRALAHTDDTDTIVIWQSIFIVICAAAGDLFWQTPS